MCWPPTVSILSDDVPAIDLVIRHKKTGHAAEARVFLCNRKTQGGGLKRQLDKVLSSMAGKACFMLRASDFPPNGKNQTAQAMRKFRESGGRQIIVPIPEWERIMTVREFHAHYRQDPGFTTWFEDARLLSNIMVVIQLLRLDLLGRSIPRTPKSDETKSVAPVGSAGNGYRIAAAIRHRKRHLRPPAAGQPAGPMVSPKRCLRTTMNSRSPSFSTRTAAPGLFSPAAKAADAPSPSRSTRTF